MMLRFTPSLHIQPRRIRTILWYTRWLVSAVVLRPSDAYVQENIFSFSTGRSLDLTEIAGSEFFVLLFYPPVHGQKRRLSSQTSTYQIHAVFRFNPRSSWNSSSRCWYRARARTFPIFLIYPCNTTVSLRWPSPSPKWFLML